MYGIRLKTYVTKSWWRYRNLGQCGISQYSDYKGMTGAQITIKKLEENNIRHVFGYPGGNCLRLIDELHPSKIHRESPVQYIINSCEISSGFAAGGYSRASGKTAVVITTSGPSVTYLLPSLMDAYLDGVAVLAITGQAPTSSPSEAFQACPVFAITKLFTKWNFKVTDISQLPSALDTAFYESMNDRPGPVVVDCPSDIYGKVLDEEISKLPVTKEDSMKNESSPTQTPFFTQKVDVPSRSIQHVNRLILDTLNKRIKLDGKNCIITTGGEMKHLMDILGIEFATKSIHHLFSGGLRTKGASLGFAIGARIAQPDTTVVCIDEPNSFSLTSTELRTLVRHDICIKIMLLNSSSSSRISDQKYPAKLTRAIDYTLLAESYDINIVCCNDLHDLEDGIERFVNHKGPVLFYAEVP